MPCGRIAHWNRVSWSVFGAGVDNFAVHSLAHLPDGDVTAFSLTASDGFLRSASRTISVNVR